jgi:hypothetical protein
MIVIPVDDIVLKRLLKYADSVISQGHWGDAEITVPEYQNLYEKIRNSSGSLDLTLMETGLLVQWIEDSTKGGRLINQEDIAVTARIKTRLEKYRKTLSPENSREIGEIGHFFKTLDKITGKDRDTKQW